MEGIRAAVPQGVELMYAVDAVSGKGPYGNICKVLSRESGELAVVLPLEEPIPKGIMAKQG